MHRPTNSWIVQRAYIVLITVTLLPGAAAAQHRKGAHGTTPSPAAAATAAADTQTIGVQVALDRAGFSPGEIDGQSGTKTRLALSAFQRANNLSPTGAVDDATVAALHMPPDPIASYTITEQDASGPFIDSMPKDMMAEAKLPALGYATLIEALGEKFHSSPSLLRKLNPDAAWRAGESIKAPSVEPFEVPSKTAAAKTAPRDAAARGVATSGRGVATSGRGASSDRSGAQPGAVEVVLDASTKSLVVRDATGRTVMHAPITSGSEHDPLPIGQWKVVSVSWNPTFNYNPDLFWDANPAHSKAKIAPGPNNPVGVVWIDINKEHFGFHGTPEPSAIGRTESHGCVRLTNWDAVRLAKLVSPGTKVTIQ